MHPTCFGLSGGRSDAYVRAVKKVLCAAWVLLISGFSMASGQTPTQTRPDISNKALLTKPGPGLQGRAEATALHKLADDYYDWRNAQFPVRSSDAGLHTWDDRLTDYSAEKIAARAEYVRALLARVNAMQTAHWPKDERIDWILFRAQLENAAFDDQSGTRPVAIHRPTWGNAATGFSRS